MHGVAGDGSWKFSSMHVLFLGVVALSLEPFCGLGNTIHDILHMKYPIQWCRSFVSRAKRQQRDIGRLRVALPVKITSCSGSLVYL